MERQFVYLSLQCGGIIIDSTEQFPSMEVGLFQKKNAPNIILARMYVHTGR